MNQQSWDSLFMAFAFFLGGLLGLILNWGGFWICLFFLILGLLGMIFIGMPIWKAIFRRIRRKK